jgi:molecular chaperone HscB
LQKKTNKKRPGQFDIDLTQLDVAFKRLQRLVHPDYFTGASEDLRSASALASSRVNVAYRTLRSPSARAQYLLQQRGESALGEGSRHVSPQLLMEIMEARELVEDATTPTDVLQRLRERTRGAQEACAKDLTAAFQRGPPGLSQARDITVALAYYDKLLEEIEERQEARRVQQQQQQQQESNP